MGKEIIRDGFVGIVKNIYTASALDQTVFDFYDEDHMKSGNTFGMDFDASKFPGVAGVTEATAEIYDVSDRVQRVTINYNSNQIPVPTLGNDIYGDFLAGGLNWSAVLQGFGDSDPLYDVPSILLKDQVRARPATTNPDRLNLYGLIVARSRDFYHANTKFPKIGLTSPAYQELYIGVVTCQAGSPVNLDWGTPRPFSIPGFGSRPDDVRCERRRCRCRYGPVGYEQVDFHWPDAGIPGNQGEGIRRLRIAYRRLPAWQAHCLKNC